MDTRDAARSRPHAALAWTVLAAFVQWAPDLARAQGAREASLEEVVVTARKAEEKLSEVPVAIAAFTSEDLVRRNVRDLTDVAQYTSGFSFENYSGGTAPAPIIRGLTQNALTDRNQNVGTFVDGVHVQQQGNIDFTMLDLERIEIVKGPQNAQYGRSSFAGAINWVPRKPNLQKWEGYATGTVGTDERRDIQGSLSIPLWPDKLAVRVAGIRTKFGGTWKNNFPGPQQRISSTIFGYRFRGTDGTLGGYDNDALQGSLRFRPVDALTVDLMYYRATGEYEGGAGLNLQPRTAAQIPSLGASNPLNCSPRIGTGLLQLYCGKLPIDPSSVVADPRASGALTHSDLMTAHVEYRVADSLTATYVYGRGLYDAANFSVTQNQADILQYGDATTRQPGTGFPSLQFAANPFTDEIAQSHELRLDGRVERFTWRLGYYHANVRDIGSSSLLVRLLPLSLDPTGQTQFGAFPFSLFLSTFHDASDAVFGSIALPFGDWTLEAEGRKAREKRAQSPLNRETTFDEFTPRVNLKWQPRPGWMFYGSVARGSKAGGFNGVTADVAAYAPEKNLTYEIGGKQSLAGDRVQLNYAVFYVDWKDLQLSVPDTVPSRPGVQDPNYIGNVAGAKSRGIELDALIAPLERVRINVSASYVQSTFKDGIVDTTFGRNCETSSATPACVFLPRSAQYPLGGSPIGGNDLPRTPRTKGSLGGEYLIPVFAGWQLSARADVSYQGKYYVENLNLAYLPARTLLNANLALTDADERWYVAVWGKNLTDEVYASSAFAVAVINQYGPALGTGRTAGVTLRYRF